MEVKKVAVGCDHAGYPYKDLVVAELHRRGIQITDYGTDSPASVDYPDFVHPVATDVESGAVDLGVVICGSGNGAAITANKHQGVRAALCWNVELAELARQHNDANVLSLPARFVSEELALEMLQKFLDTPFEGGRHARRVGKIACS